jgi:GNAT superfamily N-acetyltransferase
MSAVEIRVISAAETRPIRHLVLRPHQSPEMLVYAGDDAPDSLHVGAFLDGALVGVASVLRQSFAGAPDLDTWQLRGMATLPNARRMGCGAALVHACIAHVEGYGGAALWCNGRTSALRFYRTLGFETLGEEFMTPETGPHFVMWRAIGAHEAAEV